MDMKLKLAGQEHQIPIPPGFMAGVTAGNLDPIPFKKTLPDGSPDPTGGMYIVYGNNPDTGEFLVYDPRTGWKGHGSADKFPGIATALTTPPRTPKLSDAEAKAKGIRDAANRQAYRTQPTASHTPTTPEDVERAIAELRKRYQLTGPAPNKFGG
jgi:hypothetical protein